MRSTNSSLSLKLLRFIAFMFMLHVLMISFTTDKPIPFFAPPNIFIIGAFLYLALLAYMYLQCRDNKAFLIGTLHVPSLLFGAVIVILALYDLIIYGTTEWWVLYGSLFFILYYFAFSIIFSEQESLIAITKKILHILLILSLCLMMLELYQLIVLEESHDMLLNKASIHYETTQSESNPLFLYRPLGLTGNYTVNSVLIVIAAQFLLMLIKPGKKRKGMPLVELYVVGVTVIGVLVAQSGTGYVMLAAFLSLYFMEKLSLKINVFLLSGVAVLSVFILLQIGYWLDIYRITSEYFFHNYFILIKDLHVFVDLSLGEMLFGTDPTLGLGHIDTGPSVMLLKTGLIGLGAYLAFFAYMYRNSMGRERILVILFVIGSLRYPVVWNQVGQMLLALYLLSKPYLSQVSWQALQRR